MQEKGSDLLGRATTPGGCRMEGTTRVPNIGIHLVLVKVPWFPRVKSIRYIRGVPSGGTGMRNIGIHLVFANLSDSPTIELETEGYHSSSGSMRVS
uniref:Uncharacterized protein n=1 Tax=Glossina palpalis gambiensis TaxID=67801 RepID=A0A1B0BEY0_9MUSC